MFSVFSSNSHATFVNVTHMGVSSFCTLQYHKRENSNTNEEVKFVLLCFNEYMTHSLEPILVLLCFQDLNKS